MTTSLAVRGTRAPMRPHNKSTLWEEFLEHPVKELKYFNTKHKKAYCKRCIRERVREIEDSEEYHKEFQQNTNITANWDDWKELKAFESIEPISGRGSNMRRHIISCDKITNEERMQIMKAHEDSQASKKESPASVPPSGAGSGGRGGEGSFPASKRLSSTPSAQAHPRLQPRSRNPTAQPTTPSDDDDSNSSTASPPLPRRNTGDLSRSSRPSPRLSVQSILNEETAPGDQTRSRSADQNAIPGRHYRQPRASNVSYGPILPPIRSDTDRIGVLDSASQKIAFASEEISHVRNSMLSAPHHLQSPFAYSGSSQQHSSQFRPLSQTALSHPYWPLGHQVHFPTPEITNSPEVTALLRQRDDEIHRLTCENAELKRKYNVLKQEYDGYKRRGTRAALIGTTMGGTRTRQLSSRDKISSSSGDDEEDDDQEGDREEDEEGDTLMETPRASSAPALLSPVVEHEQKKRKFAETKGDDEG